MAASKKTDYTGLYVRTATVDLASIAAVVTAETDVTVADVRLASDQLVNVIFPSTLNAGLGYVGGRVKADNTVTIRIMNTTAGALDAASATFTFILARA